MKKLLFFVAGIFAIAYAVLIVFVFSGNYTPEMKQGTHEGIRTAINVVGLVGLFGVIHLGLQATQAVLRLEHISTGERWFEIVTSVLPIATLMFMWWYMSGATPKVIWWATLVWWCFWTVLLSTIGDFAHFFASMQEVSRGRRGGGAHGGGGGGHHP